MAERERDLDRLLTFVDAIVAIAITLLVLPLAEVAGEVGAGPAPDPVSDLLTEHAPELYGFLLSFVVIAKLWLTHHSIVSGLVRQDTWVVQLTLGWALTIVFLPFTTALVAEAPDEAATKVLYIGTMTASSAVLAAIAWVIGRRRELRDTEQRPDPLIAAASVMAFLVALTVSVAVPTTGYWPLLLLLLADPAARIVRGMEHEHR